MSEEQRSTLLLEIWREVSKHLELHEAIELIAPLVRAHVPVDGLIVRRVDLSRLEVAPAAANWLHEPPEWKWSPARLQLRDQHAQYLFGWATDQGARRLSTSADQLACDMLGLRPNGDDMIGGVIHDGGSLIGLMAIVAEPGVRFGAEAVQVASGLLEPLAAAIANDARMAEITRLQESVQADNRALLTRLARHDLTDAVVGRESGLRDVMEKVAQVAGTDTPVLIIGETGAGKEVVARAIHEQSNRRSGPILRVNCGAIPSGLVDSELFGHERGSFTGAVGMRKGWFERADGGTLFLDEIAELTLDAQVRLLRILQDGTYQRVGGEKTQRVDVRVVAATHRDLGAMVRAGSFRQDLWYRLSVFPIHLPPLRDRIEDIPTMAAHFAYGVGTRLAGRPLTLTREDIELLVSYPWPGNVRELAAVIERAAILGGGARLEIARALGIQHATSKTVEPVHLQASTESSFAPMASLEDAMAEHIRRALAATGGKLEGKNGAAHLLRINPHTLRARMRKLNIDWREFRRVLRAG